jgi:ATP-dependent helicase Lhr and Lhr-like helicase
MFVPEGVISMPIPFHPVIRAWFKEAFGQPTDVQNQAWRSISGGHHTLIAAPTGSGKTLAALLPCLDRIASTGLELVGEGDGRGVKVLYVTPLKALNNDIHHHMFRFAAEMSAKAKETGEAWRGFTVGVRTGDTSQSTRASMLRNPPDLLITTPESLYLMLTSLKAKEMLRTVRQVIVDEIHDLAPEKRGAHLSLSLERLAFLCGNNPQRIGVSATQKPMERVARFLGGWEEADPAGEGYPAGAEARPRPVRIIESAMERKLEVMVTMPDKGVRAMDKDAIWAPLVERLLTAMEGSRSVLIFVNNRRLCERLTLRLNDYVGYTMARSHHGSVSREKRLEVEAMLKSGELGCLVATSTLELGIDVGHVDLVIQIDSPKQAAAGIQRVGRAGHAVGGASRGVFVVRSRGDLPETAVLARAVALRDIEDIRIPRWPLDVLAQHTVAAVAASAGEAEWEPEELYRLFARSDCFREFPYERYSAMLDVLSGLYPFSRPLLGWDRDSNRLSRTSASSMAASMGAGTIQQTSAFPVHHAESRLHLGELDEEFVYESRVGDVFQLGTSSWTILSIRQDRVYVTESADTYSEIPFWKAEPGGRSEVLGRAVGKLLGDIRDACREENKRNVSGNGGSRDEVDGEDAGAHSPEQEIVRLLQEDYYLQEESALELVSYVRGQDRSCLVPTDTLIVAEHYKDDGGRHHLVIHSLLGRRINRTWEMVLRARFDSICSLPVYSAAKDDGLEFVFSEWDRSWTDELNRLTSAAAEQALWDALPGTAMFGKAFRHIAETSLLLTRGYERQASWTMRHRSESLLREALPFADRFPFLREAYSVCLEQYLDVPGLFRLLEQLRQGKVMLHVADTIAPSPFAMRFMDDYAMTALYESDALGRDVHMRLLNVNRSLAAEWFGADGLRSLISENSIAAEALRLSSPVWLQSRLQGQAKPEELDLQLHRLLKEYGDLSEEELGRIWSGALRNKEKADAEAGTAAAVPDMKPLLSRLAKSGKAVRIPLGGEGRWISRDEASWYEGFPHSAESSFIAKRYAERVLSFVPGDLEQRFRIGSPIVRQWLESWKEDGIVEPAPFAGPDETDLYTASKIAGRIVHTSIRDFRLQHSAVEPVRYAAGLLLTHHLHPSRRLSGTEGLLEVISRLQGLYLPLSHWESIFFPARLTDYRKEMLDQLCATGDILWLGSRASDEKEGRIAFFLSSAREMAEPYIRRASASEACSHPELLRLLTDKGASFLSALARETGELPSELLVRLMELVWEGRVSNDQFAPLRTASASPKAKAKPGSFQSGLGRWYAVIPVEGQEAADALALHYCKHWMEQFGILTRGASALGSPYPWEQLSEVLRRLEEWGMVTRGLFVRGIGAMQFSTKEQVEKMEGQLHLPAGQPVILSAVDPANPFGAWLEWPDVPGVQFARKPGNFLVYDGDSWLLWMENYGKSITTIPEASPGRDHPRTPEEWSALLSGALRTLMSRYHLRKIVVERWNGAKGADSGLDGQFMSIGAERDRNGYVFWPSALRRGEL